MMVLPPLSPGHTGTLKLWDKRPKSWLITERRKNTWSFSRGFQQRAPREEDRKFGDVSQLLRTGMLVRDLVSRDAPRFGGFDPAGERRIGNALVTAALVQRGTTVLRVITNMQIWRGSYAESASIINTTYLQQQHTLLMFENNGTQGSYMALVHEKSPSLPLMGWNTGFNKKHLETGIPGLETQIRTGLWVLCMDDPYDTDAPLVDHDPGCECAYHTFIADLHNYDAPGREYDLLMALWFCSAAIMNVEFAAAAAEAAAGSLTEDTGYLPDNEIAGSFLS